MPLTLIAALVLAFGLDRGTTTSGPLSPADLRGRLLSAGLGLAAIALVSFALGLGLAWRVRRAGRPTRGLRRALAWGSRLVDGLGLGYFAGLLFGLDWWRVVGWGLGLRRWVLVDEILILGPFLAAQLAGWCGLYLAERAIRPDVDPVGRHVALRARQALGLVLPVALIYALGRDLLRLAAPRAADDPWVQLAAMVGMGLLVLGLAPAFVRLSWPTRPLEPGPLRDRLERLARRLDFRYTDLLVWETRGAIVNAGVTGAFPWFRYVLLTDALIDRLDARQVEAVFGHEVGHIAHRHLPYFAFFFLGSLGVLSLLGEVIEALVRRGGTWLPPAPTWLGAWPADRFASEALGLAALAAYFFVAFGFLSRRFGRQADVFGCRAVSCDRPDCPPHADLGAGPGPARPAADLCPVGIRIFAGALAEVALLNGIELHARSWRHGSIRRRIAFVEGLEGRPEAVHRFQAGVRRLRIGLTLVLLAASAAGLALALRAG